MRSRPTHVHCNHSGAQVHAPEVEVEYIEVVARGGLQLCKTLTVASKAFCVFTLYFTGMCVCSGVAAALGLARYTAQLRLIDTYQSQPVLSCGQ